MSDLDYILHGGARKGAPRKQAKKRKRPVETGEASMRATEFYRRLRDAGMSVVDAKRIAHTGSMASERQR